MKLEKEVLDNGIVLFKNKISEVKTILLSINVKIGSLYEDKDKRGISHFLEHMMFKSNNKYTARQISMGLELYGGISNAFTSTFLTSYFVEVLPIGFQKIIDILFYMFENEKYRDNEFETEKRVVLSEVERIENNPESLLFKLIPQSLFGKSDYGEPISGYRETIESISKNEIEEFKSKFYLSNNIFILIEGNFSKKHVEIVKKYFSKITEGKVKKKKPSKMQGKDIVKFINAKKQMYFAKSFEINEKNYYVPFAFSEIVSGGISSLLFNIFREKYGIGYKVVFEPSQYYEDCIILSLAIPGYESEKDKYIQIAYEELIDEINSKKFEEYFKGRKRVIKLFYEKLRTDLFKRAKLEPFLIFWNGDTIDEFYKKVLRVPKEKIVNFVNDLKEHKIVKLIPK